MKRKFSLFVTIVVCLLIAAGILSACNDNSEQDPGAHVHSMELTAAKEATCTEGGNNAYYYCSGCGKYFKDEAGTQETTVEAETIPAGHIWNDGEVTTEATCTTDGVMTYTCLDCAETKIETSHALGHGMTIIKAKDATCTEAGNNAYYHCTRCNKYFKDIEGEEETTVEAETISARHKIVDGKCTICGKLYTVGLKYSLSGDGAYYIVTGIGTASGDIIIPDTHEGLPVTYIGSSAFRYCSSLTSIETPAGVTSIGYGAFWDCSNLESVTFAEGSQLTSIGDYAFEDCSSLISIEIPAGVTSIGFWAFYECRNLNTVYYAGSIEDWFNIEFENVYSNPLYNGADLYIGGELVTEVVVPESVTVIEYQLRGCTNLTSITIHSGVTSIGGYAFYGCSNLESVTFAEGSQLTSIGDYAFDGCSSLTSIEIPAGVSELPDGSYGSSVFSGCSNLESVTFAEGSQLTCIGDYAFYECGSLTSIEIPAGVTSIGDYAFYACSNLESVTFAEGSELTSIGYRAFDECSSLESIEIPAGVTSIGDYAFYACSNLESVTFAEGSELTDIGDDAFLGCSSLTSIEIPAGVTSIGYGAFYGCSNLESVTFAEGSQLTSIGGDAFSGCSSLTSIEIPAGVTSIGRDAFIRCYLTIVYNYSDLEITAGNSDYGYVAYYSEVVLTEDNLANVKDENGYVTYTDGEEVLLLGYLGSEKDIVIPDGVTRIVDYAFYEDDIVSVTLPESLTGIGVWAFDGCYNLKEVYNNSSLNITAGSYDYGYVAYYAVKVHDSGESESIFNEDGFAIVDGVLHTYKGSATDIIIPDIVTSIADYAFYGNNDIISVTIPAGVTSIEYEAFYGCSNLESVTFVEGSELTSIGGSAFYGCSNLESVIFAEGSQLTSIGGSAFYGCSSLTSIEIPAGVTSIEYEAFYGCSNLESVSFAEGSELTSIGGSAFRYCSSLTSIEIPAGVTSIGDYAFRNCSNLESVTFAEGSQLTSIGGMVFYGCSSLTSIEIPARVTSIGSQAFRDCSNLESVSFAEGSLLTSIGSYAFRGCSSLTSIEIPAGVTELQNGDSYYGGVFSGCSNLESVTFAEGSKLTSIGDYAFEYCSSLKSIEIPAGVTSIGVNAFYGCSNLNTVYYAGSIENWFDIEFDSNPLTYSADLYIGGELLTEVVVPETITTIGTKLSGCTSLTSIIINSGVTSIGGSAFSGCSNLESVTFAEGSQLTGIGSSAFSGCSSLKSIEIPAGVTSIGSYAFYYCSSLTSIEIPVGVTSIGYSAFEDCSNLESVTFAEESQLTSIGSSAFSYCSSLTSIEIPAGVTELPDGGWIGSRYVGVFYGCSNLESVTFGEGSQLTSIGVGAFFECGSLMSIEIPAGVTSIGDSAFYECSNLNKVYYAGSIEDWFNIEFEDYNSNPLYNGADLYIDGELVTKVVVPESVTAIGDQFYGCTSLTSITIHFGVTSIGSSAFSGCSNLESVSFAEGSQLTSIGEYAFSYCSSLTSIEIPAGVTELQNGDSYYGGVFSGCSNLESVTFAEGSQLTSIGGYAFYNCSSLTSIDIPAGVTSIGSSAFCVCRNLETIYYNGTEEQWNVIEKGTDWDYGCENYEVVFLGDAGAEA